ncbi:MAG: phosphoglucosamine mutase [Rhodobacteraceae bacterium]|nr:phosphoglucosamine mutase [Paracoccaceae bacterium]
MSTKSRNLFGTDGVRGRANSYPMTAETALKLGAAAGKYFSRGKAGSKRVVIGKDTRRSGYMLETALTAGFTSAGMNVELLGPMPTPGVGYVTRSMRADVGVMISASHNPAEDNGIKFFGPDGFKLSDEEEASLEALFTKTPKLVDAEEIGRAHRIESATGRYVEVAKNTLPRGFSLAGLKVVVDCANGAAYKVAPKVLYELGADVIPLGVSPNGYNINDGCGSTHPSHVAEAVSASGAHMGIALDGDADRIILVDETGEVADGDQLMGLIASRLAARGALAKNTLVATVMSNLGLERWLEGQEISLLRTKVGDRYVVEAMREQGLNLGGEQSGHIVMADYATTGDGLLAGLQFLAMMVETGKSASTLARVFEPVPQKLVNVRYAAGATPLETLAVQSAIADAEERLAGQGRLLIRKSGTEPLIRVMAEAEDETLLNSVVSEVAGAVEAAA